MMELEARRKGLDLTLQPPTPDVTIVTDAGKLRQALLNLVGNAIKFTDRGCVTLAASAENEGEGIVFQVHDTGLGIASEHLPRVFDAFWQVDQAATRRAGGTGLGLHVTRRLVRLLGGDVLVESILGVGSTFTIRMPRIWWNASSDEHVVELAVAVDGAGSQRAEPVAAKRSSGAAPRV
jgi:signal transduction histidine kinase